MELEQAESERATEESSIECSDNDFDTSFVEERSDDSENEFDGDKITKATMIIVFGLHWFNYSNTVSCAM